MKVTLAYPQKEEIYTWFFKCKCGEENILRGFKFCPSCGKKITKFEAIPSEEEQAKRSEEQSKNYLKNANKVNRQYMEHYKKMGLKLPKDAMKILKEGEKRQKENEKM